MARSECLALYMLCSPEFPPGEKLNRIPDVLTVTDVLTVKSQLDRPIRASWKAMRIKADVILARDNANRPDVNPSTLVPFVRMTGAIARL